MAGRLLASVLKDFPEVGIEKIEFLKNRDAAKAAGVRSIPALVYGEHKLTGFLLTRKNIREFLESI